MQCQRPALLLLCPCALQWMSCYSVSLETSALSEPFDGALFLALVNTSADNAQESNEVRATEQQTDGKHCRQAC